MSFVEQVVAATSLHLPEVIVKVLEAERQVLLLPFPPALKDLLKKGLWVQKELET